MKKNFREALVYLVFKYKNYNSPIGDLCRDIIEDRYLEELEDPEWVFNYISGVACTEAKRALEVLRKKYNEIIDSDLMKVLIDKKQTNECGDTVYSYKWEINSFNRDKLSMKEGAGYMKCMLDYMESIPHKYYYNRIK